MGTLCAWVPCVVHGYGPYVLHFSLHGYGPYVLHFLLHGYEPYVDLMCFGIELN
jgi:hypothetical protein